MRPAIWRAPGACATSNPRGISHYPANLGEQKCQIQNSSRDGTRCVKTGSAARRRRREFLVVVLPLERRAHGAIESDLPGRNLPQRQHRRLVLRLDQRPCPCHELPGALGREQDQREAVVHERKAVFDGDTGHGLLLGNPDRDGYATLGETSRKNGAGGTSQSHQKSHLAAWSSVLAYSRIRRRLGRCCRSTSPGARPQAPPP